MKAKRFASITIIVAFIITIIYCLSTLAFGWFSSTQRVYTSDDDSGQIARIGMRINLLFERLRSDTFPSNSKITYSEDVEGSFDPNAEWGSKNNPYIISLPRHMINLYALQSVGYFYDRYIKKNYDSNNKYITDSKVMPYFLVCDTNGSAICVNGNKNGSNIEIQPIGNENYPFIGCIGGAQTNSTATTPGGKSSKSSVIANFNVVAKDETDVGLFGKIGYLGDESSATTVEGVSQFNGAISYVNDLLLYDVTVTSKQTTLMERLLNHLFNDVISKNIKYAEDHHVGILAGHIEYASVTNISVYYSSDDVKAIDVSHSGANYLSDSGIIGLVYNLNPEINGNAIGTGSGSTIAGNVEGYGEEWGGSIDMKTLFTRLRSIYSLTSSYSQAYVSAEIVLIDEKEGTTTRTTNSTTNYTTTRVGNTSEDVDYYYNEDAGSFVFADGSDTNYALFHGKSSTFFPKKVTTITKTKTVETGFVINNGTNYLNGNYTTSATLQNITTGFNNASVWQLDNQGHLFTYLDTNPNNNVSNTNSYVKYYLNSSNTGVLSLSTSGTTVWTKTEDASHKGTLTCQINGRAWYLTYDNGWKAIPFHNTFTVANGTTYLGRNNNTTNFIGTNANAASWCLENGRMMTYINNTIYYLNVSNSGVFSLGTTATTTSWAENDGILSLTLNGDTWYLRYNSSVWSVFPSLEAYTIHSGNDYFGVNSNDLILTNADNAAEWIVDGSKLYTPINGTKYYLVGFTDGSGEMSLSTTRNNGSDFSYNMNGGTMSYSGNGHIWYLYSQGDAWVSYPATSYVIISQNNQYLKLASTTTVEGSTIDEATGWIDDGSGHLYTYYNNANRYLVSNGSNVTLSTTASTTWTQNQDGTITNNGGWYLVYDNGWKCYPSLDYILIHEGDNYLSRSGTSVINGTVDNAERFFLDGNKLYSVNGTNIYYLRGTNNALSFNTDSSYGTEFTYNEANVQLSFIIDNTTYYVIYNGSNWTVSTTTTSSGPISSGSSYLNVNTSTTDISRGTSSNGATQWVYDKLTNKIYTTTISGTTYYLRGLLENIQTRSTTNLKVTTNENDSGTNWNYSNNNLSCTLTVDNQNVTYYLVLESNTWKLMDTSKNYYLINNRNNYYLNTNSNTTPGLTGDTSQNDATLWTFSPESLSNGTEFNLSTVINGRTYYLQMSTNNNGAASLSVNPLDLTWYIGSSWFSTYYCIRFNNNRYLGYDNGWKSTNTTNNNNSRITRTPINYTPASITISGTRYATQKESNTLNANSVFTTYNSLNNIVFTNINLLLEQTINNSSITDNAFTSKDYQVTTKVVATEAGGYDTYFPLAADNDSPYAVNQNNTGYIVGGSHATYQQTSGDVRVSSYYTFGGSYLTASTYDAFYRGDRLEVLTRTYASNGFKRVSDSFNASNTSVNRAISGTSKVTVENLKLQKYEAARGQLHTMFVGENGTATTQYNGSIYGMHFMDAEISMDNLITANKVVINRETFYNYEMPEDCIDFKLKTKGFINFFAGTYYLNTGYKNNCFFSLNHIIRDKNKILELRHIKNIYGNPNDSKSQYIYLYYDIAKNEYYWYNNGVKTVETSGTINDLPANYILMFDTDWIERPDNLVEKAMYYFEIPVNAGEYALGSVTTQTLRNESARYGAYLCYLDIGGSAASHTSVLGSIDFVHDNLSNKVVTVTDTSSTETTLNYYTPSLIIIYTKNSDENNAVKIDEFVIKVRRTINSVNDANATTKVVVEGSDQKHVEAVQQAKNAGDTLNFSNGT